MTRLSAWPVLLAFVLCFSSSAKAQTSRIYFAGYLGLVKYNDVQFNETSVPATGSFAYDNGNTFAGALGLRLSQQLRFEAEYSYSRSDLSTIDIAGSGAFDAGGELKNKVFFGNLYYDFDVPWAVQPFVGGGLGYGWQSGLINDSSGLVSTASGDSSGVMYNVGGGFKYRPRSDLAFTAGYRYVDSITDASFGNYEVDLGGHEIRLGIEWDLPVTAR